MKIKINDTVEKVYYGNKNIPKEIHFRIDTAEERVGELENITTEVSQP